eukprot:m.96175 g.96175  ORF g.96175 m.96175 type:complete len:293 (+) comp13065_c0_seq1:387-1265(+)
MDLNQIEMTLGFLGPSGVVLSAERRVGIMTSLTLLQNDERFESVEYWGRIVGTNSDYYIAQGRPKGDPFKTKSFYSTDCISWAQLPDTHPVLASTCAKIRGMFTGNPSHEFTVREAGATADQAKPEIPAELAAIRQEETKGDGSIVVTTTVTEEKRLAAAVMAINFETSPIPRGVLKKTSAGEIEHSHSFGGLSTAAAAKLENYLHRRAPGSVPKSPEAMAKADPALDFMDSLKEDIPKKCWSIQYQQGSKLVVLRSMTWPGFTFFHVPHTPLFGHVYQGDGQRNNDLIFEL